MHPDHGRNSTLFGNSSKAGCGFSLERHGEVPNERLRANVKGILRSFCEPVMYCNSRTPKVRPNDSNNNKKKAQIFNVRPKGSG